MTLAGLGALSSATLVTPIGLEMLHYPLDPVHARILVASFDLGCANEIIDVLSCITSGHLWIDRASDRDSTSQARQKFVHRDGDHLTGLNVFRAYLAIKDQRAAHTCVVKWCKDNFVNGKTLAMAHKVRDQLRDLVERNGRDWRTSCGGDLEVVNRSLLQGLYMNTALIQPDGSYRQTAGTLVSPD
jgi:HrpA-like RNA helicase